MGKPAVAPDVVQAVRTSGVASVTVKQLDVVVECEIAGEVEADHAGGSGKARAQKQNDNGR